MSIIVDESSTESADTTSHDLSVKELLETIVDKLNILILHQEDATDEHYDEEDLSNGDNR